LQADRKRIGRRLNAIFHTTVFTLGAAPPCLCFVFDSFLFCFGRPIKAPGIPASPAKDGLRGIPSMAFIAGSLSGQMTQNAP
jgi:hypothetical protein